MEETSNIEPEQTPAKSGANSIETEPAPARSGANSIELDQAPARPGATRDLSPAAVACAGWFRRLSRALKLCRLYKSDNAMVVQARDQVLDLLEKLVQEKRGWTLYFTPTEMLLDDEPVIRPNPRGRNGENAAATAGEEHIPFIFYRDGIRAIRLPPMTPREELEALFDALRAVGGGLVTQDDLVTLLWQANLNHIQIDSVPLEQVIYVSARRGGEAVAAGADTQRYGWTPSGAQIHADLGQGPGTQALQRDTFDDWELADHSADVPEAYGRLAMLVDYSLAHFREAWEEEKRHDWTDDAGIVLRRILTLDPSDSTRLALSHAIGTWIGEAMQRVAFVEAKRAVELLGEFDPERKYVEKVLMEMTAQLDHDRFIEYLDQAEPEEHGRFAALAVELGRCVLDLVFAVMSKTREDRVRAAACTALTYLCADNPKLLAPYFSDAQGDVMVNLVFTLGQIGGPEVLDLLKLAAQHPEPKVRKQVVMALGGVPTAVRVPPLMASLETQDGGLIAATLQILTRDKTPKVASAIIRRIRKPDFESLPEDTQWALFNALADVADDECVASLEELLFRGGLFARRSFGRSAAARTLQRIGTERARAVLARGLRTFSPVIRHACTDVTRMT